MNSDKTSKIKNENNSRNLIEKILVRSGNTNFQAIGRACQISRRIKNRTNYLIKNSPKPNGKPQSHRDVDKFLKNQESELYQKHPSGVSQRMTQIVGSEWKSFYEAIKAYKKNPESFEKRPRSPKYAHKSVTTYIPRNSFKLVDGYIHFAEKLGIEPIKTMTCQNQDYNAKADITKVKEVRFVPAGNGYFVEVIYDISKSVEDGPYCPIFSEGEHCPVLSKENILSIDLGLDNLAALVSNKLEISPVLINGKVIKSINAFYNKQAAQLRSSNKATHLNAKALKRSNQISDYLHKASHFIIQHCIDNDLGNIVIGKNEQWKKEINIGKKNNQNFVSIPHARLIQMIEYKAKNQGIKVIVREESYTSKASALDFDPIPNHGDEVIPLFSGKRVKRGLYKTKSGQLLNADINAALNILRKEFGDEVLVLPADRGCVFNPVSISFHCKSSPRRFGTKRITSQLALKAA